MESFQIFQLVALGIVGTLLAIVLRETKKEFATLVGICTGVLIIIYLSDSLLVLKNILQDMSRAAGINMAYMTIVIKIIGIAYISEFGMQICKDAGEGAIASKIELGGKILIMAVSAPMLSKLLQTVLSLST